MKLNYLYGIYFFLGCIACVLIYFKVDITAIIIRWLGLLLIGLIYLKKAKFNKNVFYLSLIFSGIAETFIVLDFIYFFKGICISYIIYAWLVFLLVKKSVENVKYKINIEYIVPLIVSSLLIIYLIFTIFKIINPRIEGNLIYVYVYITVLLLLSFYLGILYFIKHNIRYIWLLFLLITFISSNIVGSIDALYYHTEFLEHSGYVIQTASHFFMLKFLITPEEDIKYI